MEVKVDLKGFEQVEAGLAKLPEEVRGKTLTSALRSGANLLRKEAMHRAPVYAGPVKIVKYRGKRRAIVPRLLRHSIRVTKDKEGTWSANLILAAKAFYAHFVEWGTVKMSARPFMRPALDAKGDEVIAIVQKRLGKLIETQAQKLMGGGRR